jgi:SAM-dependent methyltransferase
VTKAELISDVLASLLPTEGLVLELAAGTGEQSFVFAERFGHLIWQPTDRDPDAVATIAARRDQANVPSMLRPLELDVTSDPWPVTQADFVTCIDLVNNVAIETMHAMFAGAARALPANAVLLLYGAVRFHGKFTAPATAELDRSLRSRDAACGVRDIRELTTSGTRSGLALERTIAMPEHQHALVFRRRF